MSNYLAIPFSAHSGNFLPVHYMSVPTLAFFKNGELVKKNVGAVSYEELEELINSVK